MTTIAVDPAALAASAARLDAEVQELRELLQVLDQQTSALRDAWEGDAYAAYAVARDAWSASMAEMQQALAVLVAAASASASDYRTVEAAGTSLWRSFPG